MDAFELSLAIAVLIWVGLQLGHGADPPLPLDAASPQFIYTGGDVKQQRGLLHAG